MARVLTEDEEILFTSVSMLPHDPISLLSVNSVDNWDAMVELVTSSRVSIVLVTNTKLNAGVGRKAVAWPNYRHLRRDDACGGILLHFHHTLKVTEITSLRNDNFQGIWFRVSREQGEDDGGQDIIVGSVHNENKELLVSHLDNCIQKVRSLYGPEVNLVLGGECRGMEEGLSRSVSLTSLKWASPGSQQFLLHSPRLGVEARMVDGLGGVAVLGTLRPTGCSICCLTFDTEQQLADHRLSPRHKKNWVYNYYIAHKAEMLRSPHPLGLDLAVVSADSGVVRTEEQGVIEITSVPGQVKQFKLQLRNDRVPESGEGENDNPVGFVVENVAVPREEEVFRLSDEHNLTSDEETKIRIRHGKRYKVQVTCSSPQVGHYRVPMIVVFYHDEHSELMEGQSTRRSSHMAVELLLKVQTEEMEDMLPAAPFQPRKRVEPWYVKETVWGNPLPRPVDAPEDSLMPRVPLGRYPLSETLGRLVANRFQSEGNTMEEKVELARARELLEQPLTSDNYSKKLELLLYCEEWQEARDIRYYDMEAVELKLENQNGLVVLEVPGLQEGRPSLLKGDKLYVRETGKGLKEYEGFVHIVGETKVWLGFSERLLSRLRPDRTWDVRFSVSLFPLTNMHRAVRMAQTLRLVTPTLFPGPECLATVQPNSLPHVKCFNPLVQNNPEQFSAVSAIVAGWSGPAPYIVFGPPGTGKTVTMVEAIKQVFHHHPGSHILATAPSNTAADLLAERLGNDIPADKMLRLHAIARSRPSVPPNIEHVSNINTSDQIHFPPLPEVSKYRVLVTTLITAGRLVSAQFPAGHFGHVFIDEAGQATEPETCVALAGLVTAHTITNPGGKVVMAGDPKQLGPIVRSPVAEEQGLSVSLLEHLMNSPLYARNPNTGYDGRCITKLVRNFRSHPGLLTLPAKLFYESELSACADPQQADSCLAFSGLSEAARGKLPFVVCGVMGQDMREEGSPSFFNPMEVVIALEYVDKLIKEGVPAGDIGIITPYRRQVQKVRDRLGQKGVVGVTVGTTEEFQGQERRVVIVSTVRSSPQYLTTDGRYRLGFLANPKRFNVAITRAKALLIVVGNPHILGQDPCWHQLLQHATANGCYTGCSYNVETEEQAALLETRLSKLVMDQGEIGRLEETGWSQRL